MYEYGEKTMNRDDIILMAREAGFINLSDQYWDCTTEGIERFAALVSAAERNQGNSDAAFDMADHCAAAIRARGEK